MVSVPASYFDALYRQNPDPWGFATSTYEAEKYFNSVHSLPRTSYGQGLEVGCSIGVFSGLLADRCDMLLAIDVAEAALAQARERHRERSNLRFARRAFPDEISDDVPAKGFDLIVLSEVLYYLDPTVLRAAALATCAIAAADADVLMVHWLGPTPDYPLSGDEAVEAFIAAMPPVAQVLTQTREDLYRIDLLRL